MTFGEVFAYEIDKHSSQLGFNCIIHKPDNILFYFLLQLLLSLFSVPFMNDNLNVDPTFFIENFCIDRM